MIFIYIYIYIHIYIYTEYPDYMQISFFFLEGDLQPPKKFGCYIWKNWEILLVQYLAYHISSTDIGFITINSFL